jgi:murein DD-endopeptidase MepM/ murein hydrolase activator NlpD
MESTQGTDYAAPRGTPLRPPSGTVIRTDTAGNGNYKGQTQHLFNSILAHVKILVRRGQHVNQGMLLVGW